MIPRTQMVTITCNATAEECLPIIIKSTHSRFPVVGDSRDEVLGILLAKDLLNYAFNQDNKEFDIEDIIRPAIFVPESKHLDSLLKEFRQTRNHMAIVVDEYGGVSGCVTIEDVLEQIVGDIEDEFDVDDDSFIKPQNDNQFIVKALTTIETFNDFFNTDFSNEEFDTIGGLVIHTFGYLPKRGESTTIDHYQFEIVHADNRRIRLLKMTQLEEASIE